MSHVNTLPGSVRRAQHAIRQGADTRALKRELAAGNCYAHAFLARRGLRWDAERGVIHRIDEGAP